MFIARHKDGSSRKILMVVSEVQEDCQGVLAADKTHKNMLHV